VVATTEYGQRENRKLDTDGAGLEALIQADLTLTGGLKKLVECHQLQSGRQLKPTPKPKPKPVLTRLPRTTLTPIVVKILVPTPTRGWETVPRHNQTKPAGGKGDRLESRQMPTRAGL
jgi:hypothetical protein